MEAPCFSHRGPSFSGKGRPCLRPKGEREVAGGQGPKEGPSARYAPITGGQGTCATIKGKEEPGEAISRAGID